MMTKRTTKAIAAVVIALALVLSGNAARPVTRREELTQTYTLGA